jgi:hypothetical protein
MILCAIYFIATALIVDGKITIATDYKSWLNILGLGL